MENKIEFKGAKSQKIKGFKAPTQDIYDEENNLKELKKFRKLGEKNAK